MSALLHAFELHDPQLISDALAGGAALDEPIGDRPPVWRLVEMYTRSPRFAACLRTLFDAGATLDDPLLEVLLLDDADALGVLLRQSDEPLRRRFDLACAYTSLSGVSALHVCAEYNSVKCADLLVEAGLDVDTRAAFRRDRTGGHSALFHCVNSNSNHCRPVMERLVEAGASLDIRVDALVWGGGFSWETVVFDISPISYAQCGLFPQFHREPAAVYDNIDFLHRARHGQPAPVRNVPNAYLQ
jgi:hypothetical protein